MPAGSAAQRSAALRMARSTRLVVTGCFCTNSLFPPSMQQKYCDHGRSTELTDLPGAQLLGLGRRGEECVDPAVREQLHWVDLGVEDPPDVIDGVEPDMGGRCGQKHVRATPQCIGADAPAFEVGDAVDTFPCEQLKAADVNTSEQDNRVPRIDCGDPIRGMSHTEIDLALG